MLKFLFCDFYWFPHQVRKFKWINYFIGVAEFIPQMVLFGCKNKFGFSKPLCQRNTFNACLICRLNAFFICSIVHCAWTEQFSHHDSPFSSLFFNSSCLMSWLFWCGPFIHHVFPILFRCLFFYNVWFRKMTDVRFFMLNFIWETQSIFNWYWFMMTHTILLIQSSSKVESRTW